LGNSFNYDFKWYFMTGIRYRLIASKYEARSESVEIIISRVHLDRAPVTTTIVENEMPRSRRASATTTPLSFWKTPERKLSLTLIRRHVTTILIESPPVLDEERQRGLLTANYFPALFLARARLFPQFFILFFCSIS